MKYGLPYNCENLSQVLLVGSLTALIFGHDVHNFIIYNYRHTDLKATQNCMVPVSMQCYSAFCTAYAIDGFVLKLAYTKV